MKNEIKKILLVFIAAFSLVACKTTDPYVRSTLFKIGGAKVAIEAIEHSPRNAEVVTFVADAIDTLLTEEDILFTAVEAWYETQREKIDMDPLDKELLEMLVIVPMWNRLKDKYGGLTLDIENPQVRADLIAFRTGLRMALP